MKVSSCFRAFFNISQSNARKRPSGNFYVCYCHIKYLLNTHALSHLFQTIFWELNWKVINGLLEMIYASLFIYLKLKHHPHTIQKHICEQNSSERNIDLYTLDKAAKTLIPSTKLPGLFNV